MTEPEIEIYTVPVRTGRMPKSKKTELTSEIAEAIRHDFIRSGIPNVVCESRYTFTEESAKKSARENLGIGDSAVRAKGLSVYAKDPIRFLDSLPTVATLDMLAVSYDGGSFRVNRDLSSNVSRRSRQGKYASKVLDILFRNGVEYTKED